MSKKMMIAVMAGTISLLAAHPASARGGGGGHGGMHATAGAMPGAAVRTTAPSGTVTPSTASTAGARPNINVLNLGNEITQGNGVGRVSTPAPPSSSASPGGGRVSPVPVNGGGPTNPGRAGLSETGASRPPDGTNTAGTALSSGLPTFSGSDHQTTGQSADRARPRNDDNRVFESEAAKVDRVVKSICTGC
jgi:hypothetical protein